MNNPPRLLQSCSHPEARELLRAGIAEAPRPAAVRAAALALGVGAGISVTSAASAAAVAAPSLALVVGKWVALGTLAGLTLAGGANVLSSRLPTGTAPQVVRTNPQPSLPVASAVAVPTRHDVASPPQQHEVEAAPPAASRAATPVLPPAPVAASGYVAHDLPSRAVLSDGRDLGREVVQIDAARQAVAAGNARVALQHLEQYAALDRTATLDREAQLLRIDALMLSGNEPAANRLAQAYLAQHPGDPHAARLGALVQAHEK